MVETKKIEYAELLKSAEWQLRRSQILIRDGYRCRNCGETVSLEVHHRQYHYLSKEEHFKLPWKYKDQLLITLCYSCHKKGHLKYKVPVFSV